MASKIEIISFDFDGTLCQESVYPRLFEENFVKTLSNIFCNLCISNERRSLLKRLLGQENWKIIKKETVNNLTKEIVIPKSTISKIKELSKKYTLVITTTASRSWVEKILRSNDLQNYFYRIYSTKDDFGGSRVKKPEIFLKISKDLQKDPMRFLHIGDKLYDDYIFPKKAGFNAAIVNHVGKDFTSFDEIN